MSASPIEPPSEHEPEPVHDTAPPATARARLLRFWRRRELDEREEEAEEEGEAVAVEGVEEGEAGEPHHRPHWTTRFRRRLAKNAPIFKSSSFIALEIAATMVALLLGVMVVAWWQLSKGPQELPFLEGVVESELSKARDGRPVDIERVELAWTAQRGLQLRAVDVAVLDRQRRRLSTSREVSIGISPLHLLIAQVRVTRAEFVGGEVSVTRRPDGETRIAFGPPGVDPDIIIPPSQGRDETLEQQVNRLLDGLAETLRPVGPGGRMRALSVRDARFTFDDQLTGGAWRAESASFQLARRRQALTFAARARLEGPRGPAPAALVVRTDANFRAAEVEFTTEGVRPRAIFSPAAMGIFAGLDAPMNATLIVGLDREEGVTRLEGDVTLGRGSADLPGGRFAIDGGRLHGAYDLDRDVLRVDRISLAGARNQISGAIEIAGASALLRAESEGVATFTAAAPSVVLDVPGVFDEGAALRNVRIAGRFDRAAEELSFTRVEAAIGRARLNATGRLYWAQAANGETHPGVAIDGGIDGVLEARDFVRLWPRNLARPAREYLGDAIVGADISGFTIKADVKPDDVARGELRPEALDIAFTFADADFRFLPEMSPVAGGAGAGRIHGKGLEILVSAARVEGLAVSSGTVRVPDFGADARVNIDVRAAGDARSAFRLLEQKPVDLAGRLPLQTETVVGEGAFAFGLMVPIGVNAKPEDVEFSINGQFTGVGGLERDRRITFAEGRLDVRGDHRAVTVAGPVRAGASAVNLEWVETLTPRMAASSRYAINGDFTVEDLRRLGYPLDDVATGRIGVTLRGAGAGYDVDSAEVALDLRNAALTLPQDYWTKRAGAPASARFNVARAENDAIDLTNIEIRGPGLAVHQGEARIAAGNQIERAVFARVAIDARSDARIAVERANDGAFVYDISGAFFDVSPWLVPAPAEEATAPAPRVQPVAARTPTVLRGRVRVAELGLRAGARLRDARAEFAVADDALTMASLEGRDPAGGAFTFGLGARPSDPRGRITLRANDAGFAAQALLGSENVRGGAATVDGEWTPGARMRAAFRVEMRDFTAVRVPAMTQLLSSVASLRGLAEMLGGDGMTFNSLTADVRVDGARVTISEARAGGPSLGLTASGAYDMAADNLDLNGVVVPSPGLNSMLGNVPIVGQLFVSREGEGLLGITYSLDGPIAEARVGVNPLSALAPGILRRIFEAPQPRETAPRAAPRRTTPRPRTRQN